MNKRKLRKVSYCWNRSVTFINTVTLHSSIGSIRTRHLCSIFAPMFWFVKGKNVKINKLIFKQTILLIVVCKDCTQLQRMTCCTYELLLIWLPGLFLHCAPANSCLCLISITYQCTKKAATINRLIISHFPCFSSSDWLWSPLVTKFLFLWRIRQRSARVSVSAERDKEWIAKFGKLGPYKTKF